MKMTWENFQKKNDYNYVLKGLKEDMNMLQESKHNGMNEVGKSIQDKKIEFNKGIDQLRKSHIEVKLQMKASISQINTSMEKPHQQKGSCEKQSVKAKDKAEKLDHSVKVNEKYMYMCGAWFEDNKKELTSKLFAQEQKNMVAKSQIIFFSGKS